jgi:hypothetical protein
LIQLFSKKLTRSEIGRHYIRISKESRPFFPAAGEDFSVIVGNTKVDIVIDRYGRIRLLYCDWDTFKNILHLEEESTIVFSRDPNGIFRISVKK